MLQTRFVQPPGVIVVRAKARLLRDIARSDRPRTKPNFGPAEIWEQDEFYSPLNAGRPQISVEETTPGTATDDEVQTLSASDPPTSGTFTLTFGDETTTALAFDASAATIQTALEALASIGSGNITCAGGPISTESVVCTFAGTLGLAPQLLLQSASSLQPSQLFAITGITTGANAQITIASSADDIFLKYDRFQITGSSEVGGANDSLNDKIGSCTAAASVSSGVMTIFTNANFETVADLGSIIRLTPPMQVRGRIIQAVNRWHDADLVSGMIVNIEQEVGAGEWWDINSAGCGKWDGDD